MREEAKEGNTRVITVVSRWPRVAEKTLQHDPELARRVFSALSQINGWTSYKSWLRNYVKPLARAADVTLDTKWTQPPSSRVITVKMPIEMIEELERYARLERITKSEAIREAVKMWINMMRAKYGDVRYKYVKLDS